MTLDAYSEFAAHELPEKLLVDLDERDEFPAELVKRICSEDLGVQLLFIPEEHGGMGGSAFDVYRVCERMAGIDRCGTRAVIPDSRRGSAARPRRPSSGRR